MIFLTLGGVREGTHIYGQVSKLCTQPFPLCSQNRNTKNALPQQKAKDFQGSSFIEMLLHNITNLIPELKLQSADIYQCQLLTDTLPWPSF